MPCTYVSIVDFEQIFVCWKVLEFLKIHIMKEELLHTNMEDL